MGESAQTNLQAVTQWLTNTLINVIADLWSRITAVFATKTELSQNEADHLHPVDINSLTPSSTFVKNAVLGINGVLYRAIRATSNMPVNPHIDNGRFVTNTINSMTALVIADFTLNSDWEVFTDASIEYWVASINASLSAKQDAISDLSTIRTKANSALQPDRTYTYQNQSYTIDAMMQELVKFMSKTIVTNN